MIIDLRALKKNNWQLTTFGRIASKLTALQARTESRVSQMTPGAPPRCEKYKSRLPVSTRRRLRKGLIIEGPFFATPPCKPSPSPAFRKVTGGGKAGTSSSFPMLTSFVERRCCDRPIRSSSSRTASQATFREFKKIEDTPH